jgi:hypothetical protein
MTRLLCWSSVLLYVLAPVGHVGEDPKPWQPVPGFVAPEPGEHPRLFFRRTDLPTLRERAKTPEGKAILERLKVLLGTDGLTMPEVKSDMQSAYGKGGGPKPRKEEWPVGTYSISHAAGFGFLYQITGDKTYADLGKECFEWAFEGVRDRDREGRYSWQAPGGALRAGPSLGWYAVGYDLCYDGWDEAFRRKVALAIQNYDEGKNMSLAELARGSRHMPASNHWGMQVGGAALALLAIVEDPGVDQARIDKLLEQNGNCMIRNLTEGFGDHGWFAEGDGTGCMSSNIAFAPALQAWRIAGGRDYITPRPNAPWMTLKWVMLTMPRKGRPDFPKRGAYPHNVWDRRGISGGGTFCQGFGAVTEAQKPGLLWLYNRVGKAEDDKENAPFDTIGYYPHRAVLAFVNWPFGMKEDDPGKAIPRAVRDEKFGFYMFRNRWLDEDDIIISIQTVNTRGWHKANSRGDVEVWALGKKMRWGRLAGKMTSFTPAADGSALLTAANGTSLAVDFSKASGADGMLVMTGPGAPTKDTVTVGGAKLSFLFLTRGAPPEPKVEGDRVVVGGQTVSLEDGGLKLGKMAGPWQPAR